MDWMISPHTGCKYPGLIPLLRRTDNVRLLTSRIVRYTLASPSLGGIFSHQIFVNIQAATAVPAMAECEK